MYCIHYVTLPKYLSFEEVQYAVLFMQFHMFTCWDLIGFEMDGAKWKTKISSSFVALWLFLRMNFSSNWDFTKIWINYFKSACSYQQPHPTFFSSNIRKFWYQKLSHNRKFLCEVVWSKSEFRWSQWKTLLENVVTTIYKSNKEITLFSLSPFLLFHLGWYTDWLKKWLYLPV